MNPFASKALGREIELAGYRSLIVKSDQETSILELIQAVKRERSEDIEEMSTEQSPVGEHQSNGQVERAIQNVQGQIRTMILSLESRYKMKIKMDHPILAWLVKHAAMLISIAACLTNHAIIG